MNQYQRQIDVDNLWSIIVAEAKAVVADTPLLTSFYDRNILQHDSYDAALAYVLAEKMADTPASTNQWHECFLGLMGEHKSIGQAASKDLLCQLRNNAAIKDHYQPLQCYRLAHVCWHHQQAALASYIQSKVVSLYGVDIHPAAKIGAGGAVVVKAVLPGTTVVGPAAQALV